MKLLPASLALVAGVGAPACRTVASEPTPGAVPVQDEPKPTEHRDAASPKPVQAGEAATSIPAGWIPGNDKLSAALAGVKCDARSEGWRRTRREVDFKEGGPLATYLDHMFNCMLFEDRATLPAALEGADLKFEALDIAGKVAEIPGGHVLVPDAGSVLITFYEREGSATPIKDFAASLPDLADAQWILQDDSSVLVEAQSEVLADTTSTWVVLYADSAFRQELADRGFTLLEGDPKMWEKKSGTSAVTISERARPGGNYPAPAGLEPIRVQFHAE